MHQGIDDADAAARLRAERQILAELEHPSIARLLDGGTTRDGIPYLVMEYVDGLPIDQFADRQKLPRASRLQLWLLVCDAVQYAHRNLVVHRDLKPGNILVTPDGIPKLLDFGIAKLLNRAGATAATVRALTPEYASPEQVLGRNIGTSTDIYSLGVLLFALLTGRLPYRAGMSHPAELVRVICEDEPEWVPAGLIQGDLRSILGKALRKEPERRYLSVEQFASDVRRYMRHEPVAARLDSVIYRARRFAARNSIPLVAAAAVAAAALIGGALTLEQSRRAQHRFNELRALAHSFLFEVYDSVSALPGSVETRRLVASRAQQYLDSLARDAAGDSSLDLELAESYTRLGDVCGIPYAANLGDTTGALDSYRKAQRLLEAEAARRPGDPRVQSDLSKIYSRIGSILSRQQDPAAVEFMRRALGLAEALCARYPSEIGYRLELSRAYLHLGMAINVGAQKTGSMEDLQEVLKLYRRSVQIHEEIDSSDASSQARLAPKYFYVGYALRSLGDRTGDTSYYREALEISLRGAALYAALATANPVQNNLRNVVDGLADTGILRWKCCHDFGGAMRDLTEALKKFEGMAAADSRNVEAKRDVADTWEKIGVVAADAARPQRALAACRKARGIYEELGRADPASGENADHIHNARSCIASLESRRP
jgi:tetratricopeptide (TPR) repeat protein